MKVKSLLFGILASFALVGCNNEDVLSVKENESVVQFTFNVEGAMDSRAISDGKKADRLMYGVFEKVNDTQLKQVIQKTVIDIEGPENLIDGYRLSLALLRGKTYQVVFWAQDGDCTSYEVASDMKVTVDYNGANNDELRDAFFATKEVVVNSGSSANVTLKRPFAQVNVGAFNSEYDYAKTLGVEVNQSKAVVKKVANQIDLLTGVASGEVDVEYDFGSIPNETLKGVDSNNDGSAEMYKWVSMSYLLAKPEQTKHEMEFIFINSSDKNNQIVFEPDDEIPIQRNYRTNLVGQVLSSAFTFNINIDHYYEDERNNPRHVYYIFNEATTVENTEFALNEAAWGNWCVFTAPKGNEDENLIITFNNVKFSGGLYGIMFGEDWLEWDDKQNKYVRVKTIYNFDINNVIANGVTVGNCIHDAENHMSILAYLRGNSVVKNCQWTGTKKATEKMFCVTGEHEVENSVPYDCGVPDKCTSSLEECEIGSMYAWQTSKVTLDKCTVGYLRARTCLYTASNSGSLTIGEGTTVGELDVMTNKAFEKNGPAITIKAGATVKNLKLNGRTLEKYVIIEEGATVEKITE